MKAKDEEQMVVEGQSTAEDDSSSSSELSEVDDVDEAALASQEDKTGWDLDMLRANMFAFVDGDGNIVYEKLDDDDDAIDNKNIRSNEEVNNMSNENTKDEPDEEKEEDEEEEEEEEEMKNEDTEKPNISPVAGTELPKKRVNLTGKIASSSVMKLNLETNVPEAVERPDPLPRINASLIVAGHTLYLYGGILEVGDREITLDDMWTLDLRKRENWECLWPGTMHKQVWRGAVFDDDDSYISTGKDDDSDDDDDDDDDDDGSISEEEKVKKVQESTKKDKSKRSGLREEAAQLIEKFGLEDESTTPSDGESLADFYTRTSKYWNQKARDAVVGTGTELSTKEVKREGFKLAQTRFEELKPVIDRLVELRRSLKKDAKGDSKKKVEKSKKSARR